MQKRRLDYWPFEDDKFGKEYEPVFDRNRVRVETRKNVTLETYPSWTDERFNTMRKVFKVAGKPTEWNYDDRLWQWSHDAHERGKKAAESCNFPIRSAARYEVYLSAYHEKPVELLEVQVCIRRDNGYPCVLFAYRFKG